MDGMLFNALYGCYFSTVYHILKEAENKELSNDEYGELIRKMSETYGFPGVTNAIVRTAVDLGENEEIENNKDAWPFFDREIKQINVSSVKSNKKKYVVHKNRLNNITGIPLSTIEKMWLKSIYSDPRIRLFVEDDTELPEFNDVEPLFDWDDFVLFDQYTDGDPFREKHYIDVFRKVLKGVNNKSRIKIKFRKPQNNISFNPDGTFNAMPDRGLGTIYIDAEYIEYSERDNRFRLIGNNPEYGRNTVNISSIAECCEVEKTDVTDAEVQNTDSVDALQEKVVFELVDDNNVLERFLLNFSHYEKSAEEIKDGKYRITINYDKTDETDLVIRTLSFGPYVKAVEPKRFAELIKDRLWKQMDKEGFKSH